MNGFRLFTEALELAPLAMMRNFFSGGDIYLIPQVMADWYDENGGDPHLSESLRNLAQRKYVYKPPFFGKKQEAIESAPAEQRPNQAFNLRTIRHRMSGPDVWKDNVVISVSNHQQSYNTFVDPGVTVVVVEGSMFRRGASFRTYTNNTELKARIATPRDRTEETREFFNLKYKDLKQITANEVPDFLIEALFWHVLGAWASWGIGYGKFHSAIKRI